MAASTPCGPIRVGEPAELEMVESLTGPCYRPSSLKLGCSSEAGQTLDRLKLGRLVYLDLTAGAEAAS